MYNWSIYDVATAHLKILFQNVESLKTIKNFRRLKVRETKVLNSEEIFVKPEGLVSFLTWIR